MRRRSQSRPSEKPDRRRCRPRSRRRAVRGDRVRKGEDSKRCVLGIPRAAIRRHARARNSTDQPSRSRADRRWRNAHRRDCAGRSRGDPSGHRYSPSVNANVGQRSQGLTTRFRIRFMQGIRTLFAVGVAMALGTALHAAENTAASAKDFIREHEKNIQPLEIEIGKAWWNANVSGKDEDFAIKEAAENKLNDALANSETFKRLKTIYDGEIGDPIIDREINVLYLQYLEKQVDTALLKRMTAKANTIEKPFNVFRAEVAGKSLPDGEVRQVLQRSKDSKERRGVWEA